MKRCIYGDNAETPCPIPNKWSHIILRDTCEVGEYGRNCAAIFGQLLIAQSIDLETYKSSMDVALGLINTRLRLTQTPAGIDVPQKIRESIGHTTFPLRAKRPEQNGKVLVHHLDLYLSLLNLEKLEEANWYNEYYLEHNKDKPGFEWWYFEANEGKVDELAHPVSSIDQYDQSFLLGAATLWNTWAPPLLLVREAQRGPAIVPVSELFSKPNK